MKRILLLAALITMATSMVRAQERMESLRIAFITRQLQLTPQEAQVFWPVFNIYDEEMKRTLKDLRQKGASEIELEEKILELHKKYKPNFLKVISEEKFNSLMRAERTWGEMLRKEMQRRQGGGGKPGKPDN
jgi:hypothetical protein